MPKRPSQENSHEPATSPRFTPAGPRWRIALATLQAPFVRARAAAPIRIGFPIPLTGPYQEEALDMLRGGHVAVAMFNAQGELGGQTAELVTRDDELEFGQSRRRNPRSDCE